MENLNNLSLGHFFTRHGPGMSRCLEAWGIRQPPAPKAPQPGCYLKNESSKNAKTLLRPVLCHRIACGEGNKPDEGGLREDCRKLEQPQPGRQTRVRHITEPRLDYVDGSPGQEPWRSRLCTKAKEREFTFVTTLRTILTTRKAHYIVMGFPCCFFLLATTAGKLHSHRRCRVTR